MIECLINYVDQPQNVVSQCYIEVVTNIYMYGDTTTF